MCAQRSFSEEAEAFFASCYEFGMREHKKAVLKIKRREVSYRLS